MNLQLHYDTVLVGEIEDVFCDQDTWYGKFGDSRCVGEGALEQRVCHFITFCRSWNARCQQELSHNASEFDQFTDLLSSGLWFTKDASGASSLIDQAPNFYDGEVSWLVLQS
jgi:hypothetical protein